MTDRTSKMLSDAYGIARAIWRDFVPFLAVVVAALAVFFSAGYQTKTREDAQAARAIMCRALNEDRGTRDIPCAEFIFAPQQLEPGYRP